jgi:hypothetical protein
MQQYCQGIKRKYAKLTTPWTDDLHSEWVTRNYLAVKMILSALVMLTTFEYCREKNVRIVQPYLLYYAAISCCRAVHFTGFSVAAYRPVCDAVPDPAVTICRLVALNTQHN